MNVVQENTSQRIAFLGRALLRADCAYSYSIVIVAFLLCSTGFSAQTAQNNASSAPGRTAEENDEVRRLREAVEELRAEVAQLKSTIERGREPAETTLAVATSSPPQATAAPTPEALQLKREGLDFLRETTIDLGVDTYYGYNFNNPIGRVNLLRAYDVSSNAFSLNQANLIFREDPDVSAGRRLGGRLDFQYGQATETLQGNASNEPRPDVYRPIFQAYGTYIFPAGNGLTVDVGKWASSLGLEGNYTKDQINYSRSLWFDFLPFYHMGARVNYKLNDLSALNYWIVNGTQQTEPFNGFKDQMFGWNITPNKNVNWTFNYYLGQEHPDVIFFPNGGAPPNSPTLQGLPFQPIANAPSGKLHIIDTYVTWQATPRLEFAAEGDYVIERLFAQSAPQHTDGGAAYVRYQLTSKTWAGGRGEYMSDGGVFTGIHQALKEVTLTYDYKLADHFLARTEWRRDFSNRDFFLTDQLGILSSHQTTATMGLIWWWGTKDETW